MKAVYTALMFTSILTSCKSTEEKRVTPEKPITNVEPTKVDTPAVTHIEKPTSADTVFFSKTEKLNAIDESNFQSKGLKIVFKDETNQFDCKTNAGSFAIKLDEVYSGPGFQIDKYENPKNANQYYLIVEAEGDPGTDWYLACRIENDKLLEKHLVNEPRANSEETELNKFLSIYETGNNAVFAFAKKYLAGYSVVPKNMKQDKNYCYWEFQVK